MKCPACEADLIMSERVGVEIDSCPRCRGVWLDRGELDKILERTPEVPDDLYEREEMYDRDEASRPDRPREHSAKPYAPRRRKSFLMELFDFD